LWNPPQPASKSLNTEPKKGLTAVSAGRRGTRGIITFINKRKQHPTELQSTVKIMVGVAAKQSDFDGMQFKGKTKFFRS
jgi:hypothetical protein